MRNRIENRFRTLILKLVNPLELLGDRIRQYMNWRVYELDSIEFIQCMNRF